MTHDPAVRPAASPRAVEASRAGPTATPADEPERVRTGRPGRRGVRAVEELDDRPVDEHVAVFESAHDELRRRWTTRARRASPDDHPAA